MLKLKEAIEKSIAAKEKISIWVAVPAGILHGEIAPDSNDDSFSLSNAKFLFLTNDKDNNHYIVDKVQINYSHVAAWGYDADLNQIV